MAFSKIFSCLLDSTVWGEPAGTRLVWVTMLVMADRDGVVEAPVPGLARRAVVTLQEAEAALEYLLSPDPYSRSTDFEGRRIEKVEGGWRILNHDKYRAKLSAEDIREKGAKRQSDFRKRKRDSRATSDESPLRNVTGNANNDRQRQRQRHSAETKVSTVNIGSTQQRDIELFDMVTGTRAAGTPS